MNKFEIIRDLRTEMLGKGDSNMDKLESLSYCIVGEDGKNTACKLNCDNKVFNNWKERYKRDFSVPYIDKESANKPLDVRNNYFDPDGAYQKNKNHLFYEHLVKFLNKSEDCFSKRLEGHFKYEFVIGNDKGEGGIKVSGKDKNGKEIPEFYLRSDQLGFSAPTNKKAHPYDLFIEKSADKKGAIEKVCDWVSKTRTIGGSFLWPMQFWKKYNPHRGGTITSRRTSRGETYYIQDRVDLTLQEIQNWYLRKDDIEKNNIEKSKIGKDDILNSYNTPDSNLDIWLQHFKDFKTYVEFFCFDEFVKENKGEIEGKQEIKSIISGAALPRISDKVKEITRENMDYDQLYKMLDGLCQLVIGRSNKMIERINSEKKV